MLSVSQVRTVSTQDKLEMLSDEQIQMALGVTLQMLQSFNLDPSKPNYESVLDAAHFTCFEWYIANPLFYKELEQGRLRAVFTTEIPPFVKAMLSPIIARGWGTLYREGGR